MNIEKLEMIATGLIAIIVVLAIFHIATIDDHYIRGYCHALKYDAGVRNRQSIVCYTSTITGVFSDR